MKGETVKVKTKTGSGATDPFGAPIATESVAFVENVLVSPGPRSDLFESNRPNADTIRYSLYFPKTFDGDLEDAEIEVRGSWYKVVGHPDHYGMENTPTDWWLPVEVQATNG